LGRGGAGHRGSFAPHLVMRSRYDSPTSVRSCSLFSATFSLAFCGHRERGRGAGVGSPPPRPRAGFRGRRPPPRGVTWATARIALTDLASKSPSALCLGSNSPPLRADDERPVTISVRCGGEGVAPRVSSTRPRIRETFTDLRPARARREDAAARGGGWRAGGGPDAGPSPAPPVRGSVGGAPVAGTPARPPVDHPGGTFLPARAPRVRESPPRWTREPPATGAPRRALESIWRGLHPPPRTGPRGRRERRRSPHATLAVRTAPWKGVSSSRPPPPRGIRPARAPRSGAPGSAPRIGSGDGPRVVSAAGERRRGA